MTEAPVSTSNGIAHPDRGEIARYLLRRGLDPETGEMVAGRLTVDLGEGHVIEFPDGLSPVPAPIDPAPSVDDPLPAVDVVVITWTVDEVAGLGHVLTPGVTPEHWHKYARNFATYRPNIRPYAPAAQSGRLGSYLPTQVGSLRVLCMSPSCTSTKTA